MPEMDRRSTPIAVTGIGIVSPLGIGREAFWSGLMAGQSGIAPRETSATTGGPSSRRTLPTRTAAIRGGSLRHRVTSPVGRRMDELSRRFVASAHLALEEAGLEVASIDPTRLGIVAGSMCGNLNGTVEYLQRLFRKGPALASPLLFPNLVLNAPASYTSMELGSVGGNLTVAQGEVSGEQAVALGCAMIRGDRAGVVLAGGGDELSEILFNVYRGVRALAGQGRRREWSSPYDRNRSGVILGEGAAWLVLESREEARRREARSHAEIVAELTLAVPCAPFVWPAETGGAPARLRDWLAANGGLEVDLVVGSANSSRGLDGFELRLLHEIFPGRKPALTSIKGAIGEFGGAGALSLAAACLALDQQLVPPLCHLEEPSRGFDFDFVGPTAEARRLDRVLALGVARGGVISATLLQRAAV